MMDNIIIIIVIVTSLADLGMLNIEAVKVERVVFENVVAVDCVVM